MSTETSNLNLNNSVTLGVKSSTQMLAIIVAAAIAVIGVGLWLYQVVGGFQATHMRNLDSWGLYIISFMLFVGLSAGGLIISSVPKVFKIDGFGGISKIAIWTSICCTVLALSFVVVDLGRPERAWHLLFYSNFTSPLMWDVIVISLYLIVSIIYLWATVRQENGLGSPKAMRTLSVIALICAISVHTVTAWIIGLQQGRDMWHTALMGPWFVSSALLSGLALVLIVIIALRKVGYLQLDGSYVKKMCKLLGVFTAVDLYFFVNDLMTSGYPGAKGLEVVHMLTSGPLAPFFWCEILCGVIVMAIAFYDKLRTTPIIVLASVLSILAIFCKRILLVVGGFQIANINYAQVFSQWTITNYNAGLGAYDSLVYYPSLTEVGVSIGVLALGVFLLLMGLRLLPLKPTQNSH